MNKIIQILIVILLPVLVAANMYLFVSGITLGDQINYFENQTTVLHERNVELTRQTSYLDSLQYAASMAATLNFVNDSKPMVLDNLRYALNR